MTQQLVYRNFTGIVLITLTVILVADRNTTSKSQIEPTKAISLHFNGGSSNPPDQLTVSASKPLPSSTAADAKVHAASSSQADDATVRKLVEFSKTRTSSAPSAVGTTNGLSSTENKQPRLDSSSKRGVSPDEWKRRLEVVLNFCLV
jgi:hypothetical protein